MASTAHPLTPTAGAEACPLCGAGLHSEQEWCLSCGAAARTRLAAAPSWKGLMATLAVVVALSLGVLAAALVKLAAGTPAPPTLTRTVTTLAQVTTQTYTPAPTHTLSTATPHRGTTGASARPRTSQRATHASALGVKAGAVAASGSAGRAVEKVVKRFGLSRRLAEELRKHSLLPKGFVK